MSGKKRLTLWLGGALFLLALAAVVGMGVKNMNLSHPVVQTQAAVDPVAEFKTLRSSMRAALKAQLNDIAHDPSAEEEIRAMAQGQLLDLCRREEQETTIEGILAVRGWTCPVVSIHTDCANVLLKTETITHQESSVILELVCRETGIMSGNVKIIPIN